MWLLETSNLIHCYQYVSYLITWKLLCQTLIISVLLRFIYKQFIYALYVSPLKNMPSTNFVPIAGCVLSLMKVEAVDYGEMWFRRLKSPISRHFWLFGQERVGIADADLAKKIFVTKAKLYKKSPENYDILRPLLGNGLVLAEGLTHRKSRKFCNPFFKIHQLKNAVPVFDKLIQDLIGVWLSKMTNKDGENGSESAATEFPIEKEMTNFTLDVIGKFAFNYNFEAINDSANEITQNFRKLIEFFQVSWGLILYVMFPNLNTSYAAEYKKHIENVNNVVYSMITKKRNELGESSDESKATSLLESLLMTKDEETGEKMDDMQIRDEVMTFMIAGHETTGITLCWCLLEAARHPEMQRKIREEAESVISDETFFTCDDLEKLPYTKCFIQEALRLYPAAPGLAREATEDNYLNGYLIPKDTVVIVDVSLIHRNPQYWDEPNEFRPERFLDSSTIYPYSFLPFIAGSRMCIGYKFALMEMTTALARLLSTFQFETIPGITYKRTQKLTLRPKPSVVLRVKKIQYEK